MSKNTLLISVTTFKERSAVHLNTDDKLIYPEIKTAQDMQMVDALGSALLVRLQEGIEAGSLSTAENLLIDNYITDAMVNFVLAALPISSSYQFFTKGTTRSTSDNSEAPTMKELVELSQFYKDRAEHYRERAIRYILMNKSSFPSYSTCQDIEPSTSGYSSQIWLGDD